jgi:pantothenate synthetase
MPIIREASGLAMSSRNEYLNDEQRRLAICLSQAIYAAQKSFSEGMLNALSIKQNIESSLKQVSELLVDYVHVVDENTLNEITGEIVRPARLLLAGYIGSAPKVRLIDNGRINNLR